MSMTQLHQQVHLPQQNHLLRALPAEARERLFPHLEAVQMPSGYVLYKSGGIQDQVYFPTSSIISLMYLTANGATAEIAMVGKEGMVGVPLFMGGEVAPNSAIVQCPGWAYRLRGALLKREFSRAGAMQHLLLRYTQTLLTQMSQTAVCNRHHSVDQQLCRWLLMSLDRLPSNELAMTQELIANMLGVRREGVTEAAGKLQAKGLIRYRRGHITVLDRPKLERASCECYAAVRSEFERLLPAKLAVELQADKHANSLPASEQSAAINRVIDQLKVSPRDFKLLEGSAAAMSLIHVLDQSEQITETVEECAEELATVNSGLKKELISRPSQPSVEIALEKSELVESKVEGAAEDLSHVNQALKVEVQERLVLEHELIDMKQQGQAARHGALHDPLTSLPNRGLFDDRLEQGLAQAKRHGRTLAVMSIDLGEVEGINDTHDDGLSDKMLKATASKLENMKRDDDTLTRHGEREFLYLRTELKSETDATAIAQEIIKTLDKHDGASGKALAIKSSSSPSIGIAVFPKDGETAEALVISADKARNLARQNKSGHAFAR
jgi:diguanylate cyclase (GGDEF)-like protein